jgi:hypothetical protein
MEKRHSSDSVKRSAFRPMLWAVMLMAAVLLVGLGGCDEDTPNVPQTHYPQPEAGLWLFSVWGSSATDVWAVGQPGVILHWDGAAWDLQTIEGHVFTDVWGTAANNVFAVGHAGVIYRFNGSTWSRMESGSEENFYAVGTGPYNEIYACGERGNVRRLDGSSWVRTENAAYRYNDDGASTDTLSFAKDIQSLATVNRYALGGDMASVVMENPVETSTDQWWWGPIQDTTGSFIRASVTGSADGDNYVGNEAGRILQYTLDEFGDASWRRVRNANNEISDPVTIGHAITGMWADETNDQIFLTTWSAEIATWARDGSTTALLYASDGWLSDVWGAGDGQVWAVGKAGQVLYASDGATFNEVAVPLPDLGGAKSTATTDKFGRLVR